MSEEHELRQQIIALQQKYENAEMNSKAIGTNDDEFSVDFFAEYEKKIEAKLLCEIEIDSKQQEIDLSMLNEENLTDEPSDDLEDMFFKTPRSEPIANKSLEESKINEDDAEGALNTVIFEEEGNGSENEGEEDHSSLSSQTNLSYLKEDQVCRRLQTDIVGNDMNLVFDVHNKPIMVDHSDMDRTLDEENKDLFQKLLTFKEKHFPDLTESQLVDEDNVIDDIENEDDKEAVYKAQFFKAFRLANSLQKQLDEYKKMGKIIQYLTGKQTGTDVLKEELSDDIKLIIDDLKEHIQIKESEELEVIKGAFKKVLGFIDGNHSKEIEEILENLVSAKSSKQNALKDFTDKILTTVNEIEDDYDR